MTALLLALVLPVLAQDAPADEALRSRSYPHNAQSERAPDDATCLGMCHSAVPEAGAPPDQANLTMPIASMCSMCHSGQIHWGVEEHMGKVVPEDIASSLPPDVHLVDGAVHCVSCHDVHTLSWSPDVLERMQRPRPLADQLRERAQASDWAGAAPEGEISWPYQTDPRVPYLPVLPYDELCVSCHPF